MVSLQIIIELGDQKGPNDGHGPPYGVGRANHYRSAGDQIKTFLARYQDPPSLETILSQLTDSDTKTPETLDRVLRRMAKMGDWKTSLKELVRGH